MKFPLIICCALSVIVFLAWFGYFYFKALGNAFGNVNPATGPGDVRYLFVVVAVLTGMCVVGSFFAPAWAAKYIALVPIVVVLLAQGRIASKETGNRQRYHDAEAAKKAERERKLETISQDYVLEVGEGERNAFKESFLTHDRELDTIVRIDVGYRLEISPFCIGRVRGKNLELFKEGDELEEFYRRYLNQEGKSIFDVYETRYVPDQDYKDYDLEKFEP